MQMPERTVGQPTHGVLGHHREHHIAELREQHHEDAPHPISHDEHGRYGGQPGTGFFQTNASDPYQGATGGAAQGQGPILLFPVVDGLGGCVGQGAEIGAGEFQAFA